VPADPAAWDRVWADVAVPDAVALLAAVHGEDDDSVRAVVARADLPALAVILAAMVDPGTPLGQLLAQARRLSTGRPDPNPEGR
jgi:hypothetical protein